ncbi:MAG: hypothetical protein LBK27_01120 [Treponema sp.]|jgi:hypothetical protein|nr:hypothetical protein [Treponema sp.]
MKNLARLTIFFTLAFVLLFLSAGALRFLHIRIDGVRLLPFQPRLLLSDGLSAACWALPLAVYASLLAGLSYAARLNAGLLGRIRRPLTAPPAMMCLFALTLALSGGFSLGMARLADMAPAQDTLRPLGGAGLLLTQGDASIVLLHEPGESRGPRVAAFPGRPLLYQEQPVGPNNTVPGLPPVPFRAQSPWFLQSISIDFFLTGRQFESRLQEGLSSFFIYTGALAFLLVSLGFIQKASNWPLANLFLGCLAFRGVLAAETFLNSLEIQDLLASFLGDRLLLPSSWTVPLILCLFGILVNLYSFLVFLMKRQTNEEAV